MQLLLKRSKSSRTFDDSKESVEASQYVRALLERLAAKQPSQIQSLPDLVATLHYGEVVLIAESVMNYSKGKTPLSFAVLSKDGDVKNPLLIDLLKPVKASQQLAKVHPARHFRLNYEVLRKVHNLEADDERLVSSYSASELPVKVFKVADMGTYGIPLKTVAGRNALPALPADLRAERNSTDEEVVRCILASLIGITAPLSRDHAQDLASAAKLYDAIPLSFRWLDLPALSLDLTRTMDFLHRYYKVSSTNDNSRFITFVKRSRKKSSAVEPQLASILRATLSGEYHLHIQDWPWGNNSDAKFPIRDLKLLPDNLRRAVLAEMSMRDFASSRKRVREAAATEIERRALLPRPRSFPDDRSISRTIGHSIHLSSSIDTKQRLGGNISRVSLSIERFLETVVIRGRLATRLSRIEQTADPITGKHLIQPEIIPQNESVSRMKRIRRVVKVSLHEKEQVVLPRWKR